jgi:pimeloyl-ACP methyl ester carboxylesterase
MTIRSYELQQDVEDNEESALDPTVNERLGEIRSPTLVIVGDEDVADMQGIAAHVAGSVPGDS